MNGTTQGILAIEMVGYHMVIIVSGGAKGGGERGSRPP